MLHNEGFISGYRPVIRLDACHLKGSFGGQLMCDVERNENNQMFPLSITVVEAEFKVSWMCFSDIITNHVGKPNEKSWVFISDRQKVNNLNKFFNF